MANILVATLILTNTLIGTHALKNSWNTEGAPAHKGITKQTYMGLANQAGSKIIRLPLSLRNARYLDGRPHPDIKDDIEGINSWLAAAYKHGIHVIMEPGQLPRDMCRAINSAPSSECATLFKQPSDMALLAERFVMYAREVQAGLPAHLSGNIIGWEVENEPNLGNPFTTEYSPQENQNPELVGSAGEVERDYINHRFYSISLENADWYARYLYEVKRAVDAQYLTKSVKIIGAGIAHNDYHYMDRMLDQLVKLSKNGPSVKIDGFAVHPYTTYAHGWPTPPESGRPTDWVLHPEKHYIPKDSTREDISWAYYYSFQGALYNFQKVLNKYGYGGTNIWITEFGVPSYLGYRNAGPQNVLQGAGKGPNNEARGVDQAHWYLEAFGVFESWDNSALKGVMAHMILDNNFSNANDGYNYYDDPDILPYGDTARAEGSFGMFYRQGSGAYVPGQTQIYPKVTVDVMRAISSGTHWEYLNLQNIVDINKMDFSDRGKVVQSNNPNGGVYTDGYIVLMHDGDDDLTGSYFDDSLFGGNGNDTIRGMRGNDRIYGGSGDDFIYDGNIKSRAGTSGSNDIYGNKGNDTIYLTDGSSQNKVTNRVDGGPGWDRLYLKGPQSDYTWITASGVGADSAYFTIMGNDGEITLIDVEQVFFGDGSELPITNIDTSRGNGE